MIQIQNSIQLSHSYHIVLHNLMYTVTPLLQVFCQLSIITISYPNLGLNSSSLTLLVPISVNCISPSHHTVFYKLLSSTFLTNCILLEMCLVCLVFFPCLDMHIADLISNIIRGAWSGTTSVYLFRNSLFRILKCARSITALRAALYLVSELYWETGPGACVQLLIGPPL